MTLYNLDTIHLSTSHQAGASHQSPEAQRDFYPKVWTPLNSPQSDNPDVLPSSEDIYSHHFMALIIFSVKNTDVIQHLHTVHITPDLSC